MGLNLKVAGQRPAEPLAMWCGGERRPADLLSVAAQLGLRHTEPRQPPGNSLSEGEDVLSPAHSHATRWAVNTTGPLAFMSRRSTDRGGHPEAMWSPCSGTMSKYVVNR